ncbi:FMN-binding negative transcriptional regulator [Sphingomonas sp. URHD0057]|uniref:FMN-binding negative transcriptional regulator n=1 Tax=Sphingomonas sp. URHD0057 TaxID=1380389 RepID=UPI000684E5FF|nr:FMN-binding negative transcriptional regulator [Sphingomonas sp. URHD0057]
MHPNAAFHWEDQRAMLDFVGRQSFAHIFTASEAGLFVVHAPVLVREGRVWFHVARRNRIAERVDGHRALISVTGRDSYHSANWYASANQVPTWHYEAVEIEGPARRLSDEELVELLDRLSEEMEGRHSPEMPWTRGKMEPGRFEAMTRAIVGFEVEPSAIRGTRKFNQHKTGEDLAATIEGQRLAGREDIVTAIEELVPRGK